MSAVLLYDSRVVVLEGALEARITVYEVPKSKKFPQGIKLRCVLLDIVAQVPRLLLDNHEPFGYHLHTKLPHNKNHRVSLDVNNFEEAILLFLLEARKLVQNEV